MELTNELRKKYSNFIAGIDLEKIYVVGINAKLNKPVSIAKDRPMSARLDQKAKFRAIKDDFYEIIQTWQLYAAAGDRRKPFFRLTFDFSVTIHSKEKLEQDIFEIYEYNNLTLNTWPYVRELINNITTRMDLPPLTLPFFKSLGAKSKKSKKDS